MGLDPTDPDFEAGVDCPECHDPMFGGKTPRFLFFNLSGLVACPGYVREIPNGTFKIEQVLGLPCRYLGVVDTFDFDVTFSPLTSCSVLENTGGNSICFLTQLEPPCLDFLLNEKVLCPPPGPNAGCCGGQVRFTWGPEDPCE